MIHLVMIDTETGGLEVDEHCVIEIAATIISVSHVTDEGFRVARYDNFCQKITPDRPVNAQAAEVNGYDPDTWRGDTPIRVFNAFHVWCQEHNTSSMMWAGCI